MNSRIRPAILALVAALAPGAASATLIFSDMQFIADTQFTTQLLPEVRNADTEFVPDRGAGAANALTRAAGDLFPNVPVASAVNSAFASASFATFGGGTTLSGVGANGFFLRNALPPHSLNATAIMFQSITNDSSTVTERLLAELLIIPAPTMRFFGVDNFFPTGADPARDALGNVEAFLNATLIRADRTLAFTGDLLRYGMRTFRDPQTGVFSASPLGPDSVGLITEFVEPDGAIVFSMPELVKLDLALADIGPGETLELRYVFNAAGSTGFGETGFFTQIGDPFDLSESGARFEIGHVPGAVNAVPEPGTFALLVAGLLGLARAVPMSPPRGTRVHG